MLKNQEVEPFSMDFEIITVNNGVYILFAVLNGNRSVLFIERLYVC